VDGWIACHTKPGLTAASADPLSTAGALLAQQGVDDGTSALRFGPGRPVLDPLPHEYSNRERTVITNDINAKSRHEVGFLLTADGLIQHRNYGAGERSRTLDLLITNELLYQLSYTGVSTTSLSGMPRSLPF
jgi:hypothetical protein